MKQLATIGVVVILLLGAALYYSNTNKGQVTPQPPVVVVPDTPPPTVDGTPVTHGAVAGTLSLRAATSNGYLLANNSREIFGAIDINAIEHSGAKRPPLNIAVVIDRSGSMAGQKIESAKLAARRLVNVLDDQDRISIVSYGSDVSVDFRSDNLNAANRMRLFQAINNIGVGGGTNLSGGFQEGYSQVNRWKKDDTINRVILMSDGHANVGVTNASALSKLATNSLKTEISVSTLGVGLDYNEDLMTRMANEGAGNYYFIDKPNSIVSIFETELSGLASTVARNTALIIKLAPNVRVEKVFGFAHTMAGNQVWVSLSQFHLKESKNILLKLKASTTATGSLPIMDVSLSYDDLVTEKPAHHEVKLSSVVTNDAAKVESTVNVDVIARVQQVEVATTMEEAMNLYEQGKADEAERHITRTQQVMQKRRGSYKFKNDASFGKADKELEEVKGNIRAMPASSAPAKRMRKKKKARSNAIYLDSNLF